MPASESDGLVVSIELLLGQLHHERSALDALLTMTPKSHQRGVETVIAQVEQLVKEISQCCAIVVTCRSQ